MEIEKIVSTVQERVGNTDFSAQTIKKYVELNPVAEGQEPDEAYFTKAVSFLQGMQGQYNHDFSTKFAEAKKNLLTEDTFKDMSAEQIAEIKTLLEGLKPNPAPQPQESDEVKALKIIQVSGHAALDNAGQGAFNDGAVHHTDLVSLQLDFLLRLFIQLRRIGQPNKDCVLLLCKLL